MAVRFIAVRFIAVRFIKAYLGVGAGVWILGSVMGPALADDMATQLRACRGMIDPASRVACYDRVVDGFTPSPATQPMAQPVAKAAPPPSQAPAVVPPTTPIDRFGEKDLSLQQRVPENELPPDEIMARVSGVKSDRSGYATVTLDNGQVWRQIESSSLRVSNGASIKIRSGVMGVYYLSLATGNRSFRVRRVK